jgi:hypothetical protein
MRARYRRRSIHAEAIAPWAALLVILSIWWAAAAGLRWLRSGTDEPLMSVGARVDPAVPKSKPIDVVVPERVVKRRDDVPTIAPATRISDADMIELRSRSLVIPVRGFQAGSLVSTFHEGRNGRRHEAIDIIAPHGTEVLAVDAGKVVKLFNSAAGGITLYQFDASEEFVYYYAHLERYAERLAEGMDVQQGQLLGYVGTSGNAPPNFPHLHFQALRLDRSRRDWWNGPAVDVRPYFSLTGRERTQ